MKNKLFKFLKELFIYAAIVVALIYVIPQILVFVLETEHPLASITSSSMWPTFKKGDLVLIKAVNKDDIQIGNVVVYQNEKGFTIHRVVKLNEITLITKGDANNISDSPVKYEQIVGRVVNLKGKPLRLPYLGMISVLVQKSKAS